MSRGVSGANIQKVFSYGHRNRFGMAFDPYGKDLWVSPQNTSLPASTAHRDDGVDRLALSGLSGVRP